MLCINDTILRAEIVIKFQTVDLLFRPYSSNKDTGVFHPFINSQANCSLSRVLCNEPPICCFIREQPPFLMRPQFSLNKILISEERIA